jgi:hypothetical protein
MAIIQFPDTLRMTSQSWGVKRADMESASAFGSQVLEVGAPRWQMTITPPPYMDAEAGVLQSLLMQLKGKTNLLACHNLRRPVPLGTMRGTMTVDENALSGATTIKIDGGSGEAGKTLLAGDYLGLGTNGSTQVIFITANATADVNGVITITFEHPLRYSFAAGAAVTWNKPKALFRMSEDAPAWEYASSLVSIGQIAFNEDWRV